MAMNGNTHSAKRGSIVPSVATEVGRAKKRHCTAEDETGDTEYVFA